MEIDVDVSESFGKTAQYNSKKVIKSLIKKAMEKVAIKWEAEAKRIISRNSVDTGQFMNSVHYEMFEDKNGDIGFVGMDGVDYGIHHEFGTVKHWLPFYYYGDVTKPVLAAWGHRVLGLTEDEMLEMGGIEVETKETKPFTRAMEKASSKASNIFKKTFGR